MQLRHMRNREPSICSVVNTIVVGMVQLQKWWETWYDKIMLRGAQLCEKSHWTAIYAADKDKTANGKAAMV